MRTDRTLIANFPDLRLFYLFAVTLLLLEITQLSPAQAQSACQTKLMEAEQRIQAGAWSEAIHALNFGLDTESCSLKEMEQICVLLALAYDAKGERDFARASLRKLLKILPNWKPDPAVASPSFQSLAQEAVAEAQREQEKTERWPSCKKWLWIGAGAAVVSGAIVYLIFHDKEKEPSFPAPPKLP